MIYMYKIKKKIFTLNYMIGICLTKGIEHDMMFLYDNLHHKADYMNTAKYIFIITHAHVPTNLHSFIL